MHHIQIALIILNNEKLKELNKELDQTIDNSIDK